MKKGYVNQLKRAKQAVKPFITEIDWLKHATPRDYSYSGKEYGRQNFVTETEASEIRAYNKTRQSEEKRKRLDTRRTNEEIQMCRDMGITQEELNKTRLYQ